MSVDIKYVNSLSLHQVHYYKSLNDLRELEKLIYTQSLMYYSLYKNIDSSDIETKDYLGHCLYRLKKRIFKSKMSY